MKLLCKTCGNIFNGDREDKKLKCPRCESPEVKSYGSVVKRYWKCFNEECKKHFKISDVNAIFLLKIKQNPKCPYCHSIITRPALKQDYKQFSGQAKRICDTKIVTLDIAEA